jgi:hypothetical protein
MVPILLLQRFPNVVADTIEFLPNEQICDVVLWEIPLPNELHRRESPYEKLLEGFGVVDLGGVKSSDDSYLLLCKSY